MNLIYRFRDMNIKLTRRLTPHLVKSIHAYDLFDRLATKELLRREVKVVLDIGAGKQFHLSRVLSSRNDIELIGQDIDDSEMVHNTSLDRSLVSDACVKIDLPSDSVDLVLSRATVEHLPEIASFLANVFRVLRPGGRVIVTFANRWATFAIINQLIPVRLKRMLLRHLVPGSDGVLGFETHYSSYSQFRSALKAAGFIEEVSYSSFDGTVYFRFFAPLWLLVYISDLVRRLIGLPNLGSYNTFVYRRP